MKEIDPACGCPIEATRRDTNKGLPRIVIVGAGFGGLSAARALAKAPVHVTLIDRRNHHLFQPLLYQVATAGLSPSQIASPIRAIVRRQRNLDVLLGDVEGVDPVRREVRIGAHNIGYDRLIIATGARHSYFGPDEWERFAPGLKSLEDAAALRTRILSAFEQAELENDPAERARLTTFVVIGAGPTGVETAGAIAELSKKALACDYRRINPKCARIVLVEAAPCVLGAFPEELSHYARCALEKLGVEVRLGSAVTACDAGGVSLGEARIETRCIIWAAGVQASPVSKWLNTRGDRAGRVPVEPDLRAVGFDSVYVIGDCASIQRANGAPVPGVAPAAKQAGVYVARRIRDELYGRDTPPFRYKDFGAMATIGRKAAVADFNGVRLKGLAAWVVWSVAHIYFLIGFRNRVAVAMDWIWSYLTFERGARLIIGDALAREPESDAARKAE